MPRKGTRRGNGKADGSLEQVSPASAKDAKGRANLEEQDETITTCDALHDAPLPANDTKHLARIEYAVPRLQCTFTIHQAAGDGSTTGSSLWLSSQILACYLQAAFDRRGVKAARTKDEAVVQEQATPRRMRAIELGAGVGLATLVLARLGWDVVSTDIAPPLDTVLRPNIIANAASLMQCNADCGTIKTLGFDWMRDFNLHPLAQEQAAFDLVLTADTIYEPSLVDGLFSTIALLLSQSTAQSDAPRRSPRSAPHRLRSYPSPLALIALERRDPQQVDAALLRARTHHGLCLAMLPKRTVRRAVDAYLGATWPRSVWDDVEIWTAVRLQSSASEPE